MEPTESLEVGGEVRPGHLFGCFGRPEQYALARGEVVGEPFLTRGAPLMRMLDPAGSEA